jgi:hypothetical protein
MADRVEIEVDGRAEAGDLVRALAVRGLPGVLRSDEHRLLVVLDYPHESTDSLLRDLLPVLEAWRRDRRRAPLRITVEGRPYGVGSDADPVGSAGEPARPMPPAVAA